MSRADLSGLELGPAFPVNRITADFVAESLRTAIQTGALPDGAVLNQAALAERFQVSRQPVREAMRQLLAEGLIESRAHYGSVVRGLPIDRLYEMYDNRAVLEGWLIERATPKIPATTVAELRRENAEMTGVAEVGAWLTRERDFHNRLIESAGDKTGLELVTQLRSHAERYVRMWSGLGDLHHPEQTSGEHAAVLDAVERGDGARARALLEAHIRDNGHRLTEFARHLTPSD